MYSQMSFKSLIPQQYHHILLSLSPSLFLLPPPPPLDLMSQIRDASALGQPVGDFDFERELDGRGGDAAAPEGRLFHDAFLHADAPLHRPLLPHLRLGAAGDGDLEAAAALSGFSAHPAVLWCVCVCVRDRRMDRKTDKEHKGRTNDRPNTPHVLVCGKLR